VRDSAKKYATGMAIAVPVPKRHEHVMPANQNSSAGSGGETKKYGVLLVDDHPIIREGLSLRINREADFTVCGTAEDCPQTMPAIARFNPDIVVMDLGLPHGHGLELMLDVHAQYPRLPVIIFSTYDEAVYAERALRAGARGYLMKHESPQTLLDGMRTVLRGGYALSRATSDRMLSAFADPAGEQSQSPVAGLGNRELEVFQFIGRGKGTKEIANLLNLSVKTVETYRERLKKKLNATTSPELTRRAVLWVETNG
jgi:DNA-binding NarL/FixJ family response regulator